MQTVTVVDGRYLVNGKEAAAASNGVVFGGISCATTNDWCIEMTHPEGTYTTSPGIRYMSKSGRDCGHWP